MKANTKKLVAQQQALADFFAALMHDVQAYANQDAEVAYRAEDPPATIATTLIDSISNPVVTTVANHVAVVNKLVAEPLPSLQLFAPLPPVAPPPVETVVLPPVVVESATAVADPTTDFSVAAAIEPAATPLPAWTQSPFQAMLFKVAGLTLAVPLVELNGVVEWREAAVTEMPGHADFYLGLMPHLGHKVALIDTAHLVLPPDKLRRLAGDDPRARIKRVVLIHDGKYGLACDEVAEVITLKPADVRWRTSRTQRRWLAGTVVAHMCALIDATAFAQMLTSRMPVSAFRE